MVAPPVPPTSILVLLFAELIPTTVSTFDQPDVVREALDVVEDE
jgi:hypothetical protein